MPGQVSGPSGVPARGDSEQGIRDTLARLEAKIDRLAEQLADAEAEAEEIMRRAATPGPARHSAPRKGRRGDTFLRVVQTVAIAAACLGLIFAAMAPRHLKEQRFSPRTAVHVSHHSPRKAGQP